MMSVSGYTPAVVRFYEPRRWQEISGVTRTHSLAEFFSVLPGRGYQEVMPDVSIKLRRLSMRAAALIIGRIRQRLDFVELSADETVSAIEQARTVGVQGARIH